MNVHEFVVALKSNSNPSPGFIQSAMSAAAEASAQGASAVPLDSVPDISEMPRMPGKKKGEKKGSKKGENGSELCWEESILGT